MHVRTPFSRLLGPPAAATHDPHADVLALSLGESAAAIREGRLSSRELTDACLARIDALDTPDTLNAFLTVDPDRARAEADRLDGLLAAGTVTGPLHGVPIALKDAFPTAGIRTTGGTRVADWVPDRDATAVQRLRDSGALVLGKTNLHEAGFGITSNNPHHGAVRNPYDPDRIPGGSSGGSAAAVAARLCPAALGTDTGGSVRIPPALCGCVGLKPTLGRLPRGGMLGLSSSFDVPGPITRSVADAALLLTVLARGGADERDPDHRPDRGDLGGLDALGGAPSDLAGLRVGVPQGYFTGDNDPEVDRVLGEVERLLAVAGAEMVPVVVPDVELATPTGFLVVVPETVVQMRHLLREAGVEAGLADVLDRFGPDLGAVLTAEVGPDARPVPAHAYAEALADTVPRIRRGFATALDGVDLLLTPTTPAPAVPIAEHVQMQHLGRAVDTFATFIRYTFCVSVAGLPAVSLPGGHTAEGLPIGVQLVGPAWGEPRLLRVAHAVEQLATV
jgi:Asp-tRNA(Asn)/Glu-tRNA(Gln) amidotransferase A subunit family amidase